MGAACRMIMGTVPPEKKNVQNPDVRESVAC